ncbi:MAG: hypothetical protein LBJ60_07425 [Tannerellaceae bacterium]|jgi:hypothetical protein|nr:hypothetical protein [Tannerellaceae bacterium]
MNKREVVARASQLSGVEYSDCCKVVEALEQVLNDGLEASGGVKNALEKAYNLIGFLKK